MSTSAQAAETPADLETLSGLAALGFEIWGAFFFLVLGLSVAIWILLRQVAGEKSERRQWQQLAFSMLKEEREHDIETQDRLMQTVQAQERVADFLKDRQSAAEDNQREILAILRRLDARGP